MIKILGFCLLLCSCKVYVYQSDNTESYIVGNKNKIKILKTDWIVEDSVLKESHLKVNYLYKYQTKLSDSSFLLQDEYGEFSFPRSIMDTFLVHYLPKIVYRFIDHHSVSNEHNLFPLLYNDAQVKRQNSFKVFNAGDTLWNNMLIHMYNIYPVTYTEDRILNYGNPINMGFTKDGRIAYIAVSTETSPNWIFRKEMILSEYRKRRYF